MCGHQLAGLLDSLRYALQMIASPHRMGVRMQRSEMKVSNDRPSIKISLQYKP
jgi:hypothetical protein